MSRCRDGSLRGEDRRADSCALSWSLRSISCPSCRGSLVTTAKMSHIQPSSSGVGLAKDHDQESPVDVESRFPSDAKNPQESINDRASDEIPDDRAQHGVKMVEAVTLAWTKKTLATAYIL